MKQSKLFAISINRQLGSGGEYVGQQLAEKLDIFYADREIIHKAAKQFSSFEGDLESRDEKVLSFWESLFTANVFAPGVYIPSKMMTPTDRDLFNAETAVIKHIAKERSAVIIGRCGFNVLREFPNLVSIFLHADNAFRNEQVQELYKVSKETASEMIVQSDKERTIYCKTFTDKEWIDARNYDISIDTGKLGLDKTVEFILEYLKIFMD